MSQLKGKIRRQNRVRTQIRKVSGGRPRLSIFRSSKNMYAQIINDQTRQTVAAASTLEKDLQAKIKGKTATEAAMIVGKAIGERAGKAGVKTIVFDRGSYLYHGRIKAVAEGARESGLEF